MTPRNLIAVAKQKWIGLRKAADDLVDVFKPKNQVELSLLYAHGPKKGQVHKVVSGRNVVTNFLSTPAGAAPTSGRDLMRRIIAPPVLGGVAVGGTIQGRTDAGALTGAYVQKMVLGIGSVAEDATDEELDTEQATTQKDIAEVDFDTSDAAVTFIANWDETEANYTLSEVGLLSGRDDGSGNYDFLARKTFTPFTKTNEFTLQIRWTLRF